MSEFKGKIVLGVSIAILAALGIAVAFVAITPSKSQTNATNLTESSLPNNPTASFSTASMPTSPLTTSTTGILSSQTLTQAGNATGNSSSEPSTTTIHGTEKTSSSATTYNAGCGEITTSTTDSNGSILVSSSETCSGETPALTWYADYGAWSFSVTLSADNIQEGSNILARFTLTNISNQTQTVDIDDPLVNPTIYTQNGQHEIWTWNPPGDNAIENVTAHQSISFNFSLPTASLSGGQSYILSTNPGIGSPGFTVNIGLHLQLNETITVS